MQFCQPWHAIRYDSPHRRNRARGSVCAEARECQDFRRSRDRQRFTWPTALRRAMRQVQTHYAARLCDTCDTRE